MSANGTEAVRLVGVCKQRGPLRVLSEIDLTVRVGEVVAVIGPSGAGKSTLLRCINHLESLDGGRIFVGGVLVGYREAKGCCLYEMKEAEICAQRARIGMVFQSFNLFRHLTAVENVMVGPLHVLKLKPDAARARAVALLDKVGLGAKAGAYPQQLSGGQQQRVAIARALAMEPMLMLLDEPTSALDPELSNEVVGTIKALAREGRTMMIATHDMAIARDVADRVIFMENGCVVEDASSAAFFEAPRSERARQFLSRLSAH